MRIQIILSLSCFVATLTAQSPVTASLSAVSYLNCGASGFVGTGAYVPAGPLPASGSCEAELIFVGGSLARTQWDLVETEISSSLHIENFVEVTAVNFTADAGPQQFLLEYSSITPVAARLELNAALFGLPSIHVVNAVDYGNNGIYDVTNLVGAGPQQIASADLSTDPIVIRILVDSAQFTLGWSQINIDVKLVSDDPIAVTRFPVACDTNDFSVERVFGNAGLVVATQLPLSVAVFGFGQQPQSLPLAAVSSCLLVPTPDVVVMMTPGVNLPIVLPVAIRPIALHAQLVALTAQGLTSSDSVQILAW